MIPRDMRDKLSGLTCVQAETPDIWDAAWEINRGRWDIPVAELAQAISLRCRENGKLTLAQLVVHMRGRST